MDIFYKKRLPLLLSLAMIIALIIGSTTVFADVISQPDGVIEIPFTKYWDDNNNVSGDRPASIRVHLTYTHADGTSKTIDQTVTGSETADEWTFTFELYDTEADPLFDEVGTEVYEPVTFVISEDPIEGYTEDENAHDDPEISLTVCDSDEIKRHEPCNDLEIPLIIDEDTEIGYKSTWVAIKATGQSEQSYYIWTPEELTPIEKIMLHNASKNIQGFHSETNKWEGFLTGYGEFTEIGFHVEPDTEDPKGTMVFSGQPQWAMVAYGTYERSTKTNVCSITNTKDPDLGSVKIKKSFSGLPEDADTSGLSFTITIGGEESTVTYADFTDGEYLIENLPVGTEVSVAETNADTLVANYTLLSTSVIEGEAKVEEKDQVAEIGLNNDYGQGTGSVKIKKSFSGLPEDADTSGLSFTITIGGEESTVTYADFTDGEYLIEKLPVGTEVSVAETNADTLVADYTLVADKSTTSGSATVEKDTTKTIELVNTYEKPPQTGDSIALFYNVMLLSLAYVCFFGLCVCKKLKMRGRA